MYNQPRLRNIRALGSRAEWPQSPLPSRPTERQPTGSGRLHCFLQPSRAALALAMLCAPIFSAQAQTQPSARPEAPVQSAADATTDTRPDIIVTATKRPERLVDVPSAIAIVDAGTMAAQNLVSIKDYAARVPGLSQLDQGNGQVQLAIRGITTGGLANSTVGVTVDDIPVGGTTGLSYGSVLIPELDPSIISRVEVLKGPQGTLYGAASLGGLLRYVTAQPDFDRVHGSVSVLATTVAHGEEGFGGRATVNLPLSGNSGLLLNGFYRRDPGYVDDRSRGLENINRQNVYGGRVAFRWEPTDNLSIKLSALLQNGDGRGNAEIDADASLNPLAPYNQTRLPRTGPYHRRIQLYSGQLDYDLGFATLTSLTGYNYSRYSAVIDTDVANRVIATASTGDPDVAATTYLSVPTKKFVQELRLASPGNDRFEWIVGGFYTHESSDALYNLVAVQPATGNIVADDIFVDSYPLTYREIAAFANVTYHLTDRFDVQLGGRYGENKQHYHETIGGPLFDGYDVETNSRETVFTYSVSPRFRINRSMTLYARVAKGYRPGGPNTAITPTTPEAYGSDSTVNYELGFKGDLFDRLLYLEASVFRIDWDNIQLAQTDPVSRFTYFDNAGGARSQGFEVNVTASPTPGLTLVGTVGYNDAKLTKDAPLIAGSPAAGTRLPFSAPWTASVSADQKFDLTDSLRATLGGTIAYQDERRGVYQSYGQARYPDYVTVDLRASLSSSGWTLSAFASNIFDKAVPIGGDTRAPGTPFFVAVLNRPRTFGLQLEKAF